MQLAVSESRRGCCRVEGNCCCEGAQRVEVVGSDAEVVQLAKRRKKATSAKIERENEGFAMSLVDL
jgi:hypothetical protein